MCEIYFYAGHIGGWFHSGVELDAEDLYCDECGDCDTLIGVKKFSKEPKRKEIEKVGNKLYYDYLKSWDMVD